MRLTNAKEIVLETASILFYEQGYNNTSLEDIAKRCNITKQAILYHYKSKQELGMAVCELFDRRQMEGFRKIAEQRGKEKDPTIIAAARSLWSPTFLEADVKAARFYKEYISSSEIFIYIGLNQEEQFVFSAPPEKVMQNSSARIERIRAVFAGKGMLDCFLHDLLDFSTEEFSRVFLQNYYQMYCSQEEFEELYQQTRSLLERMQVRILPYYKVR